jgi:hypothetical protein
VADAELLLASCRQLLTGGSRDPERQCFLAQKLASVLPSVRRDYAMLSRATKVASRYRDEEQLFSFYLPHKSPSHVSLNVYLAT